MALPRPTPKTHTESKSPLPRKS